MWPGSRRLIYGSRIQAQGGWIATERWKTGLESLAKVWSTARHSMTPLTYFLASGKCMLDAESSLEHQPIYFFPQTPSPGDLSALFSTRDHDSVTVSSELFKHCKCLQLCPTLLFTPLYLLLFISGYNAYPRDVSCIPK